MATIAQVAGTPDKPQWRTAPTAYQALKDFVAEMLHMDIIVEAVVVLVVLVVIVMQMQIMHMAEMAELV